MKRLIIFDLDGTLAESKASLDTEMATLLARLLEVVKVAVISGGAWAQFEKQVLSYLPQDERLKDLIASADMRNKILSLRRSVAKALFGGFQRRGEGKNYQWTEQGDRSIRI